MAQHDYVIANGTGAAVRSDLNNALAAIVSQNSGATAPSTTYAYQWWADTTTGLLKLRNAANSGWITLFQLDGEWSTIALENGTAGAPSIYFKDSGTDTGFYSPGANQVGISTGGTARLTIDSNGNVDIDSNTLYVDATNNRVGLGSSSPSYLLDCKSTGATNVARFLTGATTSSEVAQFGRSDQAVNLSIDYDGAGSMGIGTTTAHPFNLKTGAVTRATIDTSGRLGIGTTSPSALLHLNNGNIQIDGNSSDRIWFSGDGTKYLSNTGDNLTSILALRGRAGLIFNTGGDFTYNGGSERARIDGSGRLLVGTSSSPSAGDSQYTRLKVEGNTLNSDGMFAIARSQAATAMSSGNTVGHLYYTDNAGNIFASVKAEVDATPGSGDYPGRLVFSTTADGASSPTEAMRITEAREIWVNRTSRDPNVSSACKFQIAGSNAEWSAAIRNAGANPYGMIISYQTDSNGVGNEFLTCVGNTTSRFTARSNGGLANYSANNVNLSDRNVKKDITLATGTWDCLKKWEIVNFRYKDQPDDADLNMGVIAQQIAEHCPEVITVFEEAKDDQPEKLGVKDQQMMWMAIKALQEAQLRIETLEAEVAALKAS